jgi:hypothetical protein
MTKNRYGDSYNSEAVKDFKYLGFPITFDLIRKKKLEAQLL